MAKKKYSGQRVRRLRISNTAQRLMDGLYDEGFVVQSISNYDAQVLDAQVLDAAHFNFLAEERPQQQRRSRYYEGAGPTLYAAIRAALKDGRSI